jgi:predicted O-linked N-acetylglucosamine transferase (SPINDLY family)
VREVREAFAGHLSPGADPPSRQAPRASGPLRVGYISSHFHCPNYMKPVWALLNNHNRTVVRPLLFSDSPAEKGMPGYCPRPGDALHHTGELDNGELADLMRSSDLDILVDLNAYSAPERLQVLQDAPAPIVAAWFNMYATSGIPAVKYLIGDKWTYHPGERAFYTESVLCLPQSYLTFEVAHPVPPVVPPPCKRSGRLTFGSLVSQYKITPGVIDAWAEILRGARHARLLLANSALKSPHNARYVLDLFAARGIDPQRVAIRPPAEHYRFLSYYDETDIALDAFPYNGGTTTMEALWQGVPVLTFDGDRWASRTSASILGNTHLRAFVASDRADYVRKAIELATSPDTPARLAELRTGMRRRLASCSACDGRSLAGNMEALYRGMVAGRIP